MSKKCYTYVCITITDYISNNKINVMNQEHLKTVRTFEFHSPIKL